MKHPKHEYVPKYKKNIVYDNPLPKLVEIDPYSVIPSIAVLSSGKCVDARLFHNNGEETPIINDPVDMSNYAKRYKARMEKLTALRELQDSQANEPEPTPEPKTE